MADWKHEFTREQYELMIESLLRANAIAAVLQGSPEIIDPPTVREMAKAMSDRILECLVIGRFDEDDIQETHQAVIKDMYRRPDAPRQPAQILPA